MKCLIIIGASGHGKVVADIAVKNGYDRVFFLDDDRTKKMCGKYTIVGTSGDVSKYKGDVIVAIGDAQIRKKIQDSLYDRNIPVLIHPKAVIAEDVEIGMGTVIMAGAVINSGTVLGKGCIINTCSSVDHDCWVEDYVHISVGAHVAGNVEIESGTWIGAGSTIINNVKICPNCMVGAGAVVVKNIMTAGIYLGVPAKLAEQMEYKKCN